MWFFDRSISLTASGLFQGFTDWHCHLLPGVDDGVQSIEETMQILSLYESLGIKEVWLTPHIMEDIPNSTDKLKSKFAELQASYQGNIELHLAAEYMLDHLFEERLRNNDLLPLGKDGNHLLVETSYFNPPIGLNNILLRIKNQGYIPVIAHPERYNYMSEDNYRKLIGLGIKFQASIPSVVNAYGRFSYKKMEWLVSENVIDMWGTDTHHFSSFSKIIVEKKLKPSLAKKIKKE